MKIQPLSDYILIEKKDRADKLSSGLLLPETMGDERVSYGTVLEVCDGYDKVKTGDTVLFQTVSAIKVDDKNTLLVKKEFVIAVIQ